jgi:hypothetical protein
MALTINVACEEDSQVCVAENDDIPLVAKADTHEILYRKLPDLIQDGLIDKRRSARRRMPPQNSQLV